MGRNRYTPTIKYVGGKYLQLPWLLPRLPGDARLYCEPFGGSAVVLANRPPSEVEVYNDLNPDSTNLYRMLPECWEEFLERLMLTPYSRELFDACQDLTGVVDPIERAWRYYIRTRQSMMGLGSVMETSWGVDYKSTRARGPALCIAAWLGTMKNIEWLAARMRDVVVECRPAVEVLREYDAPDALFFVDPPYVMSGRNSAVDFYANEMSDAEHVELLACLKSLRGRWALAGYSNDLYNAHLDGVYRHEQPPHVSPITNTNKDRGTIHRTEVMWANYPIDAVAQEQGAGLFDRVA